MRDWHWASKVGFALLVAAVAYFVWPTPWRYFNAYERTYRQHRVTGNQEVLTFYGKWQRVSKR